ncbi:hypothetical protein ScalyP_jg8138 [Parmales sp. scaly parma]|nr:hypothetical protein ScalyP_jg8138 [Parmales sp. scaly parma]
MSNQPSPNLNKLKRLLTKLQIFSSNSSTNDQGLKILNYTVSILASFAPDLSISPNTESILNNLSSTIFMARYVPRFWGFTDALDGLVNGTWAPPADSTEHSPENLKTLTTVASCQALSMCLYHPCELLAWFGWTAKIENRYLNPDRMSAYSCRAWLVYILLSVYAGGLKMKELQEKRGGGGNGNGKKEGESEEFDAQMKSLKTRMLRDALYIVPALTWSLPQWATNPLVGKKTVNTLCFVEAMVNLNDLR